jgi:DNA-binding protein H-NS
MQDKEKQIEEIGLKVKDFLTSRNICYNFVNNDIERVIFALNKLGYLLPVDSVVLSRGEYEKLKDLDESYNHLEKTKDELLSEKSKLALQLAQARKETAEKILKEIKQEIFNYLNVKSMTELDNLSLLDSLMTYDVITDKLNEIEKQYGVDTNKVLKDKTED